LFQENAFAPYQSLTLYSLNSPLERQPPEGIKVSHEIELIEMLKSKRQNRNGTLRSSS